LTNRLRDAAWLAIAALFAPAAASAQKTDVVILLNGDKVTGEIKSYSQGRLSLDTSHASVIKIKWNNIASITSDKQFDVETIDGVHHYGSLAPSDPVGKLTVVSGPQTETFSFFEVFGLAAVHEHFWRRWDGSLDFGFNYTQSSNLVQFNLSAAATYRERDDQILGSLSSFFSRQDDVTAADRANFSLIYDRFLSRRWLAEGAIALDRNTQLGLDLRVSAGIGGGRYLVQTNTKELMAFFAVLGNHEQPVEGEGKYNAEVSVGGRYSFFMYDFPKVTISASVQFYASLTELGRVRLEAEGAAKREIISDFYLSLSVFDSFDSRDPSTGQARNDWGPVLSIGWTF
jgi:hypothetical protein